MSPFLASLLAACVGDDTGQDTELHPLEPPGELVASDAARDTSPDVSDVTLAAHAASMRAFSVDLLHQLATTGGEENLFCSPYSISVALAMTYAGAETTTEAQIADALHFDLPEAELHPAFNALDLELAQRPSQIEDTGGDPGDPFQLQLANQLFGQTGYPFEAPFLDTLAVNYGAAMRLLDFVSNPDGNRVLINDWVLAATEERIVDLLPPGSITSDTKLVLVNAIYFKASWAAPFDEADTTEDAFTALAGVAVTTPTMHGVERTLYAEGDGFAVVDVPYVGEALTMTLVVPEAGRYLEVRDALDSTTLDAALGGMKDTEVTLAVPRFEFRTALDLAPPLQALGMVDAFDPGLADFSGMSTTSDLFVGGVYHQAFVAVNEAGTEAAAATAVVVDDTSEPDHVTLTVDRPFLFLIRDRPTGAVLFLGQVVDPSV